jgi:hypothetical protein
MTKCKIWQNDNRTFQFTLKEGGSYVNITNRDCFLTCKESLDAVATIFDVEGTIVVASEGTFQVEVNSPETAVPYNNAICQVTTINADGDRVVYGEFYLDILPKAKP